MAGMPGMEGMPGMGAASDSAITLSAAQIRNGHIRWAFPVNAVMTGGSDLPGQLVVNEDRTARLSATAQARALTVHVSPGDRVSTGAKLVTLQSPEAAAAQSDVSKAEAEVASRRAAANYAKLARERAERLLALKAIPRQDYERAVADDDLARTALTQAESELQRARSAAEQLGVDLRDGSMTLTAPMDGVVMTRDVTAGAVVTAGSPLITVTDPASLWLTVALPEQSVASARVGGTLRFVVPAFPVDTFTGRIQSVSPAFDAATRTLAIRAQVANAAGRLRPEMFARVWLPAGSGRAALTVPETALLRVGGKTVVFVVQPDTGGSARVVKREVTIGTTGNGRSEVLKGLTMAELVVIEGAHAVKGEFEKGKMTMEM